MLPRDDSWGILAKDPNEAPNTAIANANAANAYVIWQALMFKCQMHI